MKWFFSLNASGKKASAYQKQAKVAVSSAKKNTSLEPCCLYDGEESEFTVWLKAQGVAVYFHRTPLYAEIERINASRLAIASGALLRCEIPKVLANHGLNDEYVLYTDVDVVFVKDPTQSLSNITCDYFAVSRESLHNRDRQNMNSGVMLMNAHGFLGVYESFLSYSLDNLQLILTKDLGYDQHLLKTYFEGKWEWLPETMNWKGHWALNPEAIILHFHGPKPTEISDIFEKGLSNYRLPGLASAAFFSNVLNIWNPLYEEVLTAGIHQLQNEVDHMELCNSMIEARMQSIEAYQVTRTLRLSKSDARFLGFNINPYFKQGESYPHFVVKGWIVSASNDVQQVDIFYQERLLLSSQLRDSRPDVLKRFPQVTTSETVGFLCSKELFPRFVEAYFKDNSEPVLTVQAQLHDGTIVPLVEIELSIPATVVASVIAN